jgi:hypothetical protein
MILVVVWWWLQKESLFDTKGGFLGLGTSKGNIHGQSC